MSDVKSKNLYELLGNTSDQDSDREPDPPTKAVDKPTDRHGKRDAPKAAPAPVANAAETQGGQRGGRRGGGFNASEAAFRDRATGRTYNRDKPTGENEDGVVRGRDSGPGTQRRGRGQRGPRRGGDRRDRTGQTEHQKQTDQAWGGNTGEGEWADEKAGEKIATEEIKEGGFDATAEAPVNPDGNAPGAAEAEPEDTNKSYADYLAEQAAKKLSDLGLREARAPNEGSKENKKWQSAKELAKDNEDEAYFVGEAKAHRERERATKKEYVNIDYTFKEPPREGGRGGRGRGDRGAGRGGRGRGNFEGGRGNFEGGRGRGDGAPRGRGRGRGEAPSVAVNDESAFPSLGGK